MNIRIWLEHTSKIRNGTKIETENASIKNQDLYLDGKAQVWFRTKDIIKSDRNSRLYFMHRIGRVVKIDGTLVNLDQVEAGLRDIPNVLEAVCSSRSEEQRLSSTLQVLHEIGG